MSRRPRDSQMSKVYAAERKHSLWREESQYDSISHVQVWVDSICKSRWFKNRYPRYALAKSIQTAFLTDRERGIKVLDGRGRRKACGSTRGFIKLPVWSRSDLVILHEIAHVVTRRKGYHGPLPAYHGREFCANYLALVRQFLGKEAAKELKVCFKKSRVKYTRPAKIGR
ncbi:MAG: hypothetical protein E3J69_00820 [Anaerolineales bacterium]|nr:MAG: hypothetical protein E3J69_00820 [Anaerolineales bacterium]